jgi:hypothetical protein
MGDFSLSTLFVRGHNIISSDDPPHGINGMQGGTLLLPVVPVVIGMTRGTMREKRMKNPSMLHSSRDRVFIYANY